MNEKNLSETISKIISLFAIFIAIIAASVQPPSVVSTSIQDQINTLCAVDSDGFATKSAVYTFPSGTIELKDPIVYKGAPGITLKLVGNDTKINFTGNAETIIRFEGANNSGIENLLLENKSNTVKQMVWFDAVNADFPNTKNAGSSGCYLKDCIFRNRMNVNTSIITIGHEAPVTSQVSELIFEDVIVNGPSTFGANGIGIDIRQGGNVKHFTFINLYCTFCKTGINWKNASGPMTLTNASFGANSEVDIFQSGSGVLDIKNSNFEQSNCLLRQSGGMSSMFASIRNCEWNSRPSGVWTGSAVVVHGMVKIESTNFNAYRNIPWISMTYPLHEVSNKNPTALILDQCSFNLGWKRPDLVEVLPIKDNGVSRLLDPNGIYKDKPLSFEARQCRVGFTKQDYIQTK